MRIMTELEINIDDGPIRPNAPPGGRRSDCGARTADLHGLAQGNPLLV